MKSVEVAVTTSYLKIFVDGGVKPRTPKKGQNLLCAVHGIRLRSLIGRPKHECSQGNQTLLPPL